MRSAVVLIVFISWFCAAECAHQAVVKFNARGIAGNITFTELENGSIRIQTNLRGLRLSSKAHAGDGHGHGGDTDSGHGHGGHGDGGNGYAWHVHTFPVDQTLDPAVQCLSRWVGPHYDPFGASLVANYSTLCTPDTPAMCEVGDLAGKFGLLMPHVDLDVVDSTGNLSLTGPLSIVGRSIVVHSSIDGSNFECGTIQLVEQTDDRVTLLQATFTSPLAGSIYFKQIQGEEDVSIWGKLYWVDDRQRSTDHRWFITQTAPGEVYRTGMCDNVGGLYTGGDLYTRLGTIAVAATPGPVFSTDSFFFTDSTIDLNDVRNRSLSIGPQNNGADTVACAPLIDVETITLLQPTNGYLRVSQRGPFEETVVDTATLPSTAISVLSSAFNPIDNCPERGSLFSPYEPISLPGEDTPDRYSLGDWQNRYSSLLESNSVFRLFDMPVYGAQTSISSLSVRYITGATRSCVALIPMLSASDVLLAKATFTSSSSDIDGAIYFVQQDFGFDQLGSTHVIVDVHYASQRENTFGHDWSVRESTASNQDCGASDVYNPFSVSTAIGSSSNYTADCTPYYPLRCEAGDLSGKHGQLELYSDISDRPTYTFVDPNVQLTGSYSIVGRSVGIEIGSGSTGCARIQKAYVSNKIISIKTDRDRMLRTSIARTLADGTGADFSDILVLKQEIYSIGFGFKCLNVTVRVVGPTPQEAEANAEQVALNTEKFVCNRATFSVGSMSVLVWTLSFVLLALGQLLSEH